MKVEVGELNNVTVATATDTNNTDKAGLDTNGDKIMRLRSLTPAKTAHQHIYLGSKRAGSLRTTGAAVCE